MADVTCFKSVVKFREEEVRKALEFMPGSVPQPLLTTTDYFSRLN